mgnify:CR=1 FL=1
MPSVVNELDGGMPVKHLLDISNQIMKERLFFYLQFIYHDIQKHQFVNWYSRKFVAP